MKKAPSKPTVNWSPQVSAIAPANTVPGNWVDTAKDLIPITLPLISDSALIININWANTEYAKTKDILYVMKLLGHKSIETTLLYTQLINFETDEFHSATAKTIEESTELIKAGFEYVCTYNDILLFRKRK